MTDYRNMADGDLVSALKDNAAAWAKAFIQLNPNANVAEDVMIGWFANAIEGAHDYRTGRIHNGDHAEYLLNREKRQPGT